MPNMLSPSALSPISPIFPSYSNAGYTPCPPASPPSYPTHRPNPELVAPRGPEHKPTWPNPSQTLDTPPPSSEDSPSSTSNSHIESIHLGGGTSQRYRNSKAFLAQQRSTSLSSIPPPAPSPPPAHNSGLATPPPTPVTQTQPGYRGSHLYTPLRPNRRDVPRLSLRIPGQNDAYVKAKRREQHEALRLMVNATPYPRVSPYWRDGE